MTKRKTSSSGIPLHEYFRIFYGYSGRLLWLLCGIIFVSGLLEGFGVSLLLPILSLGQEGAPDNAYTQGLHRLFAAVGVPVTMKNLLALLFSAFFLKGVLMFLQGAVTSYISTQLIKKKRLDICQQYAEMSYSYYTQKSIGFLNNLITTEIDRAIGAFGKFSEVLATCVYIVVYLFVAVLINWRLTILAVGLCVLLFVALRFLSQMARLLSIKVSEKNAQIQALLIQMIYNFKYLKATSRFSALNHQLETRIEEHRRYQFRNSALGYLPPSMLEPLAVLFLSGMILYFVSYQSRAMSEILVLLLFFYKSFSRMFGLQIVWHKFSSCVGGVEVLERMTSELATHKELQGTFNADGVSCEIKVEDISYRYASKEVLSGISMSIPAKQTVAIVGESGCGKTTVLDMIAGLIVPESGAIRLNGRDYRSISKKSFREHVGYVTQEPAIFNDTIANNISFWSQEDLEEARLHKIKQAAALTHSEGFINQTEHGYDSVIGDKGVKLSVGQRQRIAIARELFKNPSLILFDEATSALDSESERLIQKSIHAIKGTRTMIIVAHRLSTIKDCDFIYVLGRGKVLESGTFDELVADKNSTFSRMCKAQNLK